MPPRARGFRPESLHRCSDGGRVPPVEPRKKTNIRLSDEAQQRIEDIKRAIGTESQNAAIMYAILNVPLKACS